MSHVALLDATSMYGAALAGYSGNIFGWYTVREAENGFKCETLTTKNLIGLAWIYFHSRVHYQRRVRTAISDRGERKLLLPNGSRHPCDGFLEVEPDEQGRHIVVYEVDGCMIHSCDLCFPDREAKHPFKKTKTHAQVYEETLQLHGQIRSHHEVKELHVVRECELKAMVREDPQLQHFADEFTNQILPDQISKKPQTWQQMHDHIMASRVHGFILTDMRVRPEDIHKYKTLFGPFMRRQQLGRENILDTQMQYVQANDLLQQPVELLLPSFDGSNLLLSCSLYRYYVNELNIEPTAIHKIVQFKADHQVFEKWYKRLITLRCESRLKGDQATQMACKSTINTVWGYSCFNPTRSCSVRFVSGDKLLRYFSSEFFLGFHSASRPDRPNELLEVVQSKATFGQHLPLQLGLSCLHGSKVILFKFIFGLIGKLDQRKAQLAFGDTDSGAVILSVPTLKDAIPPGKESELGPLIDRMILPADVKDSDPRCRDIGVWKLEKEGLFYISLSNKLYTIGDPEKLSLEFKSRGFRNCRLNDHIFTLQSYFNALLADGDEDPSDNLANVTGISAKPDSNFYRWAQTRRALTRLNLKFCQHSCRIHCFARFFGSRPDLKDQFYPYPECYFDREAAWQQLVDLIGQAGAAAQVKFLGK